MGESKKYDLMDLGGGLNDTDSGTHVKDNEATHIRNFYPDGQRLRRRKGVSYVTTTAAGENVTGLFAYKSALGVWILFSGMRSGLSYVSGGALFPVAKASGLVIPASDEPWQFRQRNDILYCARKNAGTLQRASKAIHMEAGIAAPATAPTLAQGAAGDLIAADYYGVVTFYNSATGAESNPSEVSAVLALAASKKINWSAIPVSINPQTTSRRLYRVLPDQTGEYFLVATIDDNTTTTYDDENMTTDDMGDAASFSNGLPPDTVEVLELFNERLFISDGVDIYPSQLGLPESFDQEDVLTVFPDDGHEIRVLHAFGDKLLIGKTNAIHYLTGSSRSSFAISTLTDRHGCVAPKSMKSSAGFSIWFSGDNFYITDGVNVQPLSDKKITALLERVPEEYHHRVVAAVWPKLNWYLASIPLDSSAQNAALVVYNYRDKTWTVFEYAFGSGYAPSVIADFYSEDYAQLLYASFYDGHIYNLYDEDATDDVGTAIAAEFQGKDFGLEMNNQKKGMRRLGVLSDSVNENITASIYRNGAAAAYASRTVSLNSGKEWKRLSLSSMRALSKTVRIGLEYSGASELDISGLTFELVSTARGGQPI